MRTDKQDFEILVLSGCVLAMGIAVLLACHWSVVAPFIFGVFK